MKHEIRYDNKRDARRAINDMIGYIGIHKSWLLAQATRKQGLTWRQFSFYASFAGVQGYPAICFFNHFCMGREIKGGSEPISSSEENMRP